MTTPRTEFERRLIEHLWQAQGLERERIARGIEAACYHQDPEEVCLPCTEAAAIARRGGDSTVVVQERSRTKAVAE